MIVECVPNFSEGRNVAVVDRIAAAVPAGLLLNRTSDLDHNRSVLTIVGPPDAVATAAFEAVRIAVECIDLRSHTGVHPRLGVADVVPFVPLSGATMEQCVGLAHDTGHRIWRELAVPVFFYESAALRSECARLENVRRTELDPDLGTGRHPTAGACVVGARKFLIAWNINLSTRDVGIARRIAHAIRESSGGLPAVKALGLNLEEQGLVQVSMNLVDFERTPMGVVFDMVQSLAHEAGVEIAGTELIGMLPQSALDGCGSRDMKWLNLGSDSVIGTGGIAKHFRANMLS